jgi:hypothetical protein
LREDPSPADIVYSKKYSLSELDVSGSMSFFWAQEYHAKGHFGFVTRAGSGMKWWQSASRAFYPYKATKLSGEHPVTVTAFHAPLSRG